MRKFPFAKTLFATICAVASTGAAAAPPTLQLAPVEREALLTEDLLAPTGTPLRYAAVRDPGVAMRRGLSTVGAWTDVRDAQGAPMRRWSLTVTTPGALSQDFGFAQLFLPHGASLVLRGADGLIARGPYTDADVAAAQRFQTPFVVGETATLEIDVPTALARHVSFALDRVAPAHRSILSGIGSFAKSGSCNVDVRCPQGAPYPDQINSVAGYAFSTSSSGLVCSGALINNASGDRAPYFLTANHCIGSQADAGAMVLYWKYENPGCRAVGSGASGTPIPLAGNSISHIGGADLRATRSASDFALVRLRNPVPTAANGFLAGWDRRNIAPSSAFTIHHPTGDEKRISFDNEPLQIFDQTVSSVAGNRFLRVLDYELGTTEGGSSGAPLFSPERRIVGQLAGGAALCTVPDGDDYFGRLFSSFSEGTTAATRLSDWLDPANTGVQTLEGVSLAGGCTPSTAVLSAPATARAGVPVNISLTLPAGTYRVEWDIDGDGSVDRVNAAATGTIVLQPVYPTEASVTLMVRVIASGGCTTALQRALIVDGPRVAAVPFSSPQQLCGDGDAAVEPGERWRVAVSFRNDGAKGLTDAHGVFAPVDPASIRLETPALAIASLGANGAALAGLMDFAIPTTATCGSVAAIRYLGTLDRTAWSIQQESTPFSITLGGGGPCNVITACPAQIVPIVPSVGLFGNLERFGNGIGTVVTDNPDSAPPVLFGAWFTGTRARTPIWYTVQGFLVDNRSDVEFRQFRRTSENPFTVAPTVVGTGQVTYLGPNDYLLRFNVNGQSGLERQTLELPDTTVAPDHTGVWHFPPESGSGYVVDTHRNAGVPEELVITFIYGTDNEPRWTFGSKAIAQSGPITEDYFEVHCPSCPSLVDFLETRVFAGNLSPIFSNRTTGTLSTNLFSSAPVSLLWVRNNIPIEMISTPRP